ncbi:MAG: hypothetical protein AAF715_29925 [Myxococcota bacterium]
MISRRSLLALLSSHALLACGGAAPPPVTPADSGGADDGAADAPPPPPPDADVRAVAATGAQIEGRLEVARLRSHPLAPQLMAQAVTETRVLVGTGIEPLEDIDRVFFAAKSARDPERVMVVVEHHVPADRRDEVMAALVAQGEEGSKALEGEPYPAVQVRYEGKQSLVLAVSPTVLVVTSPALREAARSLKDVSGLPAIEGEEALRVAIDQPKQTLDNPRAEVPIPGSISKADATLTFRDDGDADLHVEGQSTDAARAEEDAAQLTKTIDEKTSVKAGPVRVRVVEPVVFGAQGDRVVADRQITLKEMKTLLALGGALNAKRAAE